LLLHRPVVKVVSGHLALVLLAIQQSAVAAELNSAPQTGGAMRVAFGLMIVLAVMALIAWAVNRIGPGNIGSSSAARIVGGVSVGNRERVVVIEVADRWIVVGVAPGQVNGIANIDIGAAHLSVQQTRDIQIASNQTQTFNTFAKWLKQAIAKTPDNQLSNDHDASQAN
jgi:flagellar protein FliO/FliZ